MAEACGCGLRANGDEVKFSAYACPRLTLFAPSRSRARRKFPDGNFRRPLVGSGRAFTICRNGCAERQHGGGRALPPRRAPFGRKESQPWTGVPPDARLSPFARRPYLHASAATIRSSVPVARAIALCPRGWKGSQDSVLWFLLSPGSRALFSQQWQMGTRCVASTRGPCGAGGRAFRGLTRSATEWSAARRKPLRAAAMPLSASISADVKARRLPTSDTPKISVRKFSKRARP